MNFSSASKRVIYHIAVQLPYRVQRLLYSILYLNLHEGQLSRGERWVGKSWRELMDIAEYTHVLRAYRYYWIAPILKNKSVLDLGCGSGYGSYYLSLFADSVVGIDRSTEMIEWAEHHFGCPNLKFRVGNALKVPFSHNSFDVVVCVELIEHLPPHDQETLLKQISSIGKEKLYMTTPNGDPLCFRMIERKLSGCPEMTKFHEHEFYPREFKALLQKYSSHCTFFGQRLKGVETFRDWTRAKKRTLTLSDFEMTQEDLRTCSNLVVVCCLGDN